MLLAYFNDWHLQQIEQHFCLTVFKALFKILSINASPTLFAKHTKYPGFSIVSGNLEIGSEYITGSNQ
jgi:hypothetical protein